MLLAKRRLLILTPRFPYPVVGGDRLRIYYLCKALSRFFDLTLLSFCENQDEMNFDVPQDGVFSVVERVFQPKWRSYFNCLMALPTATPLQVAYYFNGVYRESLERLLPEHDGVLAHLIRVGAYIQNYEGAKFLEMTDAISMNYERIKKKSRMRSFKNLVFSFEARRLKIYERFVAEKFDASFLVSQVDKDYLFEDSPAAVNEKVIVCSNGVDFERLNSTYEPDGRTIVFIGNMTTVQNIDAAVWFANEVMPILLAKGDYCFRVIGRIGPRIAAELSSYPGVVVSGAVDCVAKAAAGGTVGVCPMRIGAGIQNKVLEYMALGLPTVTSTVGYEGIGAEIGKDLLVSNTACDMAATIFELFSDPHKSAELSRSGRDFVRRHHSWESMLKPAISRICERIFGSVLPPA